MTRRASQEPKLDITRFKSLSFDCYGTLIDWETGILAELRPWAARHRLALADEALLAAFGAVESACQHEDPSKLYRDILAETHRRLAGRLGAPGGVAALAGKSGAQGAPVDTAAARDFGDSIQRWPAFPDSAAALAYLKRHYKLAILSNVDRASFAHSNAKLGVAFDLVVTAEDVGDYKPSPRNFKRLLAELGKLGVAPGEDLHCAQSMFHDIAPANAIGLKTVWINRRKGRPGGVTALLVTSGAQGAPGGGATPPTAATPDAEVPSLAALADWHRRATKKA
jgi:2-haloalkanoic acid dehalogenase type II